MSKNIFSSFEPVFRCLDWETRGIKVDGKMLSHLRFALGTREHGQRTRNRKSKSGFSNEFNID